MAFAMHRVRQRKDGHVFFPQRKLRQRKRSNFECVPGTSISSPIAVTRLAHSDIALRWSYFLDIINLFSRNYDVIILAMILEKIIILFLINYNCILEIIIFFSRNYNHILEIISLFIEKVSYSSNNLIILEIIILFLEVLIFLF